MRILQEEIFSKQRPQVQEGPLWPDFGASEAGAVQFGEVRKWDYEAGIVVLGIGGAGLATAIVARDLGTDVLMLERQRNRTPGATPESRCRASGVRQTIIRP